MSARVHPFWHESEDPDYYQGEIEEEPEDEDRYVCLFPDNCCMPGPHTNDECHTPEMAEEYFREQGL